MTIERVIVYNIYLKEIEEWKYDIIKPLYSRGE